MTPSILAIDPGTEKSGVVLLHASKDGKTTFGKCVVDNRTLLDWIRLGQYPTKFFAIEQIRSYGMAIGASTLDTVEWSGRFIEAWVESRAGHGEASVADERIIRLPRLEIKVHLCGTAKAKDANIRQALIDRLGPPGTKKNPGPTYGVSSHMWSALAVAVVAADKVAGKERGQA